MEYKNIFKIGERKIFLSGFFVVVLLLFFSPNLVFSSETQGTIDATYKYAWGENIGWINFACDGCSVSINDNNISGYAWSKQYGWINLSPVTSGVKNTAQGGLSGYAWSSNLGWIDFSGMVIGSGGDFFGYATIKSDNSKINFNCANGNSCDSSNFKVKTDWRPQSARSHGGGGGGHGGGDNNGGNGNDNGNGNNNGNNENSTPSPQSPVLSTIINSISISLSNMAENISLAIGSIFYDSFLNFLKPKEEPVRVIVEIPKIAPIALQTQWNLLPAKAIQAFVFAPLPYEVRILATKFPEFGLTLKNIGIDRLSDMEKLVGVTFNIQGLGELEKILKVVGVNKLTDINKLSGVALNVPAVSGVNGKIISSVGVGKISLIKGVPLSKFPLIAKKNLPTEFVFARANGELVDLNVALSVGEKGEVTQRMSSLPGKTLRLVVKPISRARSVTGYFVFKSATPKVVAQTEISRASLTASALFSMNDLVENASKAVPVEKKLVLSSFEYTDPDHDGIYTADVVTPVVPGEYEVITVIDYIDPVLGARQMRMITVIDPEGYVFEKNNGKETRIPSAIVSLYSLNTATKTYELWPASEYQQENPQVTDIRGTYSFLVPEGTYYFQVEAPGYDSYEGKAFFVAEGNGIHQNIELRSGRGWLSGFDWQTALLIVVFLLLVYNLYRNSLRDKLFNFLNKYDRK